MLLLAAAVFLAVVWLLRTKMATRPSVKQAEAEAEAEPAPPETQELPPHGPALQPPEALASQTPVAEPPSGQTPPQASRQPEHPTCQAKPPVPPAASECTQPQGPPAPDSGRALGRAGCLLKQVKSPSWEEPETSLAQRKRQAMATFVLGSFEDNSSEDELAAGSFRMAGRRRSSLASIGASSSVDSSSPAPPAESGVVMR